MRHGTPANVPEQRLPFDLDHALARLRGRTSMLIYTHDNPDPDALAAAMGLGQPDPEAELGATVTLAHGGIVGRAQNRAMVDDPQDSAHARSSGSSPTHFDIIALVDSQPETGNNSLPIGHRIDIVIDHHPPRAASARAPWCDIRPERGATSTIVFDYLLERNFEIDAPLATAFFFALRTETRDLGRESTDAERRAYLDLVPVVDHDLLYRMTHPKVPASTSRPWIGPCARRRSMAIWWRSTWARWAIPISSPRSPICCCPTRARALCCAWASTTATPTCPCAPKPSEARAGSMMRQIVGSDGAAGGHGTMAGARLFNVIRTPDALQTAFVEMVKRLGQALGHPQTDGAPLLDGRSLI